VTYLIKFLGEFKFIFETVLGYVSGGQMGSFEAKKRSQKSHAWAPLIQQEKKPWRISLTLYTVYIYVLYMYIFPSVDRILLKIEP
jgi:hypothetical protein